MTRMTLAQRMQWRIPTDQCDAFLYGEGGPACLLPLPCPRHGARPGDCSHAWVIVPDDVTDLFGGADAACSECGATR